MAKRNEPEWEVVTSIKFKDGKILLICVGRIDAGGKDKCSICFQTLKKTYLFYGLIHEGTEKPIRFFRACHRHVPRLKERMERLQHLLEARVCLKMDQVDFSQLYSWSGFQIAHERES